MTSVLRSVALAVVMSAATWPLHGQAVSRVSGAEMQAALARSDVSDSRGGLFRAAHDNNAQFILNRRTSPSVIELHCMWDDLLVVRSGAGTLLHGSKLRGLGRYGAGEWRATGILEAGEVTLAAGDVLRIPAGQAHTILPLGDAPLVYLVVKVRTFDERACGSLPRRGS